MEVISGLNYREHLDLHDRRKTNRIDRKFKYATLIASMIALGLSIFNMVYDINTRNRPLYYISETSINALIKKGVPNDVIAELKKMSGIKFYNQDYYYNRIRSLSANMDKQTFNTIITNTYY
jgi:hypothetical protein